MPAGLGIECIRPKCTAVDIARIQPTIDKDGSVINENS
jgi:hypothetical protein